jgi:uncharacterized protein YkwD
MLHSLKGKGCVVHYYMLFFVFVVGCSQFNAGDDAGILPVRNFDAHCVETMGETSCQLLGLINDEREKASLAPLTTSLSCTSLAQDEVVYYIESGEVGAGFETWEDQVQAYNLQGLNVSKMSAELNDVPMELILEAWLNSDEHRSSLLSSRLERAGIAEDQGFWVLCLSSLD